MGNFQGINLKCSEESVAEGESPDSTNSFYYGGKYGLLGARLGKTVVNRPAGTQHLCGVFPFKGPWGQRRIVSTFDGFIWDDSIYDRGQFPVGVTGYVNLNGGTLTAQCSYNSTSLTTATDVFFGGVSYDASITSVAKFMGLSLSSSHNGSGSGTAAGSCAVGLIVDGVNTYLATFSYTVQFKAGPNFAGPSVQFSDTADHPGLLTLPPPTGTISGICIKNQVATWPVLGGSADVSFSVTGLG